MKKRILIITFSLLLLTGCSNAQNHTKAEEAILGDSSSNYNSATSSVLTSDYKEISTDTTIEHTEKITLSDTTESTTIPKNEPIISTAKSPEPSESTNSSSDMYFKEPEPENIVYDEEHGLSYVKNQLLISTSLDTERSKVVEMLSTGDYGEVQIVGEIALTGDYQVEFSEDHSLSEMQEIADYYMVFPFVENVTLNIISETAPDQSDISDDDKQDSKPIIDNSKFPEIPSDSKSISKITISEIGGEESKNHTLTISQNDNAYVMCKEDYRTRKTTTYYISDSDYQSILSIDLTDYLNKQPEVENGLVDTVDRHIEIQYDDGTTAFSEVYIQELWNKIYELYKKYEPIEENSGNIIDEYGTVSSN